MARRDNASRSSLIEHSRPGSVVGNAASSDLFLKKEPGHEVR
jgi:hypothetical protein